MTKEQLIAECKKQNPVMISIINDEEIELSGQDYENACIAWAEMRLEQIALEKELADKAAAKNELLQKLGINEDEAKLLLS